jgi:hypothetical protein
MISTKDKCLVTNEMTMTICDKIMAEYLSGNWQEFFKVNVNYINKLVILQYLYIWLQIWNISFPLDFKESNEYKIMTLNLRVHYAILPIRIVQLHQNINSGITNHFQSISLCRKT